MTPPSQKVTIAVTPPIPLKTVIAVVATQPDQVNELIARSRQRAKALSQAVGFVSMALHHSLDGRRMLEYSQWRSASSWQEAMQDLSERVEGDFSGWDVHLYEIMHVFHRSGSDVLEIAESADVIAMINVLSTDPSRQDQLMEVWRKGAERYWEQMPGAVGAALHRSEDGMRLVNYAQWTSAQAWQQARPGAGEAFAGRHGLGTSDPHLYQLDTIILAAPGHTTN